MQRENGNGKLGPMEWWLYILAGAGWLAGAMLLGRAYRQPWRRGGSAGKRRRRH